MIKRTLIIAISLTFFALTSWFLERVLADPLTPTPYLQVTPTNSGSSDPGKTVQASTKPFSLAQIQISALPPLHYDPEAGWKAKYTLSWTATYKPLHSDPHPSAWPTGCVIEPASGTTRPSPNFSLTATLPVPGYYHITVSGNAAFTDPANNVYSADTSNSSDLFVTVYNCDIIWNGPTAIQDASTKDQIPSGTAITGRRCLLAVGMQVGLQASYQPADIEFTTWNIGNIRSTTTGYVTAPTPWWNPTVTMPNDANGNCTGQAGPTLGYPSTQPSLPAFYWWSNGGQASKDVACSYSAYLGTKSISAQTTFALESPNNVVLTPRFVGNPTFWPQGQFPAMVHGLWLYLAWGTDAQLYEGTTIPRVTGLTANDFPTWTDSWVQIVNYSDGGIHIDPNITGTSYWTQRLPTAGPMLDTLYPYGPSSFPLFSLAPSFGFADVPSIGFDPATTDAAYRHDEFMVYYLAKVNVPGAMYVPLATVGWHWGGQVTLTVPANRSWTTAWALTGAFGGKISQSNKPPGSMYSWTLNQDSRPTSHR